MKLSDLKCRKAKAEEKLIKLSDGEGLFLHVYPNGKKLWRLSYRHGRKQRDMAFGPYPLVSLLAHFGSSADRGMPCCLVGPTWSTSTPSQS